MSSAPTPVPSVSRGCWIHPWFWGQLAVIASLATALVFVLFFRPQHDDSLTIGCDPGGGEPYYIEQDGNLTGFEARLAGYLAAKQDTHATFVRGSWATLPAMLKRGDLRVVLNGYEWSPEREREYASTIPYYVYKLQLIARGNDTGVRSWNDLKAVDGRPNKKVGVLLGSAAENYLQKTFGDDVDVTSLDANGTTGVLSMVKNGQLDATIQDTPTAAYYLKDPEYASLAPRDRPIEPGYYVAYVRKEDTRLLDRLNGSLREAIKDGTLKRIYGEYGLWNEDQKELEEKAYDWPPEVAAAAPDGWSTWLEYAKLLLQGAGVTVILSVLAMPLAILVGLAVAVGRLYGPSWLDRPLRAYVELLRGTPLLLQIFVIYYLLPEVGITVPGFVAAVLGLAINYSAYEAENYRAGLVAVPRGQMEAALALGMGRWTALRVVIVPQAVRIVIPTVTNDFIALFKDTSVCSVVAVMELTGRYNQLMINNPGRVIQLGAVTALLYLLMSYPLALLARRLETRFAPVNA